VGKTLREVDRSGLTDEDLPPFTEDPVPSYGALVPDLFVVHAAEGDGDGSGLARFCHTNDGSGEKGSRPYHWHWSIGNQGRAFRHLLWDEKGAHAGCINDRAVGVEHAGFSRKTDWDKRTAQLSASAQICANFCHFIGRAPSRDFIIGHVEDVRFGGCSDHFDPGKRWPWDDYMERVQTFYEGGSFLMALKEEQQKEIFKFINTADEKGADGGNLAGTVNFFFGVRTFMRNLSENEKGNFKRPPDNDPGAADRQAGWDFAEKLFGVAASPLDARPERL